MFDATIRPIKEKLLIPISKFIGQKFSPNSITLISFAFGLLSFLFILKGLYMHGLIFWGINRVSDGIDGTVARVTNRQSDFGGYIDIMADFVIYSMIPISFVVSRGNNIKELLVLSILLAIFYINAASWMYLSSILEKKGHNDTNSFTSVTMPSGLIEGFETVIFYTLFYIFPDKIIYLFIAIGFFTLFGAFQRVFWAYRNLK